MYFNVSTIVDMQQKPPILCVRGEADVVASDNSVFDLANYYDAESERGINGWTPKPQPMIGQTREVLGRYAENGGTVEEIVIENAGHSPFLENPVSFVSSFTRFLSNCH